VLSLSEHHLSQWGEEKKPGGREKKSLDHYLLKGHLLLQSIPDIRSYPKKGLRKRGKKNTTEKEGRKQVGVREPFLWNSYGGSMKEDGDHNFQQLAGGQAELANKE